MGIKQHGSRNDLSIRPALRGRDRSVHRAAEAVGSGKVATPTVFVVDDDPSVRDALSSLFRSVGLEVELFGSAADFLLHYKRPDTMNCLVLDVRLPGISGLDFQAQLLRTNIRIPIVFMTGHGDIPMSVRAMKEGAIDFLAKPFRDQDMLDAVAAAIQRDKQARQVDEAAAVLRGIYELLTPREREGNGACYLRTDEQANSSSAWAQRYHGQDSSRSSNAQNEGKVPG
jgi:FixJ family two-component response regulator